MFKMIRLFLVLCAFVCPVLAQEAPAAKNAASAADKAELRAALRLAYAEAYSVSEVLLAAKQGYSLACKDEESYTTLMMIDLMISYTLKTKKSIAGDLAKAAAVASRDDAAHETAVAIVKELRDMVTIVAKIMEPAKSCEAFMTEKNDAEYEASGGDHMTWRAASMHASINVMRLAEFAAAADLKAAQALVEMTK